MKPTQLTETEINFLKNVAQKRLKDFIDNPSKKDNKDESYLFALELSKKLENTTSIFLIEHSAA